MMNENTMTSPVPAAAAPAPAVPAVAASERRGVRRAVVLNVLALLVLVALGAIGFGIWHQGYYFYSTDDATVSAPTAQLAPATSGTIQTVYHNPGDTVHRGDTIARLTTPSGSTISVKSPLDGTIISEGATTGEVLAAGTPLAQVADLAHASIIAYVEETHIKDVHAGQGVDVSVDAISGTTFHGTVAQILPVAASALSPLPSTDYASGNFTKVTQRVPVVVTLDSSDGHTLYPGTSASVTIHIHE